MGGSIIRHLTVTILDLLCSSPYKPLPRRARGAAGPFVFLQCAGSANDSGLAQLLYRSTKSKLFTYMLNIMGYTAKVTPLNIT